MTKREDRDTTTGNTGGAALKTLSNEEIYSFFNEDKLTTLAEEVYRIATTSEEDSVRLRAISEIFDRVLGKPKQSVDHSTMGQKIEQIFIGNLKTGGE